MKHITPIAALGLLIVSWSASAIEMDRFNLYWNEDDFTDERTVTMAAFADNGYEALGTSAMLGASCRPGSFRIFVRFGTIINIDTGRQYVMFRVDKNPVFEYQMKDAGDGIVFAVFYSVQELKDAIYTNFVRDRGVIRVKGTNGIDEQRLAFSLDGSKDTADKFFDACASLQ